jgi:hypothetical protein
VGSPISRLRSTLLCSPTRQNGVLIMTRFWSPDPVRGVSMRIPTMSPADSDLMSPGVPR